MPRPTTSVASAWRAGPWRTSPTPPAWGAPACTAGSVRATTSCTRCWRGELRETLLAIGTATAAVDRFEDKAVEAALVCLDALDGSVVDQLLRNDPNAVLPLLTSGAAPLIALARAALAPALLAAGVAVDADHAAIVAESLARLGLSFVLTRDTVVPVDDASALRDAIAALVGPLLRPVGAR